MRASSRNRLRQVVRAHPPNRLEEIKLRRAEIRLALDEMRLVAAQRKHDEAEQVMSDRVAKAKAAQNPSPEKQRDKVMRQDLIRNSRHYLFALDVAQTQAERDAITKAKQTADRDVIIASGNPFLSAPKPLLEASCNKVVLLNTRDTPAPRKTSPDIEFAEFKRLAIAKRDEAIKANRTPRDEAWIKWWNEGGKDAPPQTEG